MSFDEIHDMLTHSLISYTKKCWHPFLLWINHNEFDYDLFIHIFTHTYLSKHSQKYFVLGFCNKLIT